MSLFIGELVRNDENFVKQLFLLAIGINRRKLSFQWTDKLYDKIIFAIL